MTVFVRYPDFIAGVFGCHFLIYFSLFPSFNIWGRVFLHRSFLSIIGVNFFSKGDGSFSSPFAVIFSLYFFLQSCVLSGSARTEKWDRHRIGKWRSGFCSCKVRIDEAIILPKRLC